jgi:hypothetical protein
VRRGRVAAAAWACATLLAVALPGRGRGDTQRPGTWEANDRKARATEPWYGLNLTRSAPMRVRVGPSPANLGQAITYRGAIWVWPGVNVRFEPPESGGAMTWSQVRAGRSKPDWLSGGRPDSVWIEARLQVFETGPVAIPGPVVRLNPAPGTGRAGSTRLPTVHLVVLPSITAADSNAQLRALHGPVAAPWWERVAWLKVVAGLAMLSSVLLLLRMLRRKPRAVPRAIPSSAPVMRPRVDPAAEALRALAALRALDLPAAARFGEHALELTAILRRFLEATLTSPRPGDTSGELLARLRSSRVPADDLERLEGLLALWDRVKFARAPLTEAEAKRCEDAVEGHVRQVAQARLEAAAAAARAAAARAAGGEGRAGHGGAPPTAPEAA